MDIVVPREDVNDDSAILKDWLVDEGSPVTVGQSIAVLETCKTIFEVVSPQAGVLSRRAQIGEELKIGQALASVTSESQESLEPSQPGKPELAAPPLNAPALLTERARQLNLVAPEGTFGYYSSRDAAPKPVQQPIGQTRRSFTSGLGHRRVLFVGGGNVGVQAADILWHESRTTVVGFLDDHPQARHKNLMGIGWMGGMDDLTHYYDRGLFDEALLTIGLNLPLKLKIFERCQSAGIPLANAIDPSARCNRMTVMGQGNILCSFVHVGAEAKLGDNNFIAAHSNIDHHNQIGSHNLFGPGCLLSGTVRVGDRCLFGSGVVVQPGISIGDDCRVASSTTILRNVPDRHAVKFQVQSTVIDAI